MSRLKCFSWQDSTRLITGLLELQKQSDQMPGNFRAGPEKIRVARKSGIIFQSLEIKKKSQIFLFFNGYFHEFRIKRAQFSSEIGL